MTTALDARADLATTTCWRALRLLAERLRDHAGPVSSCSLLIAEDPRVALDAEPPAGDGWLVTVSFDPRAHARLAPAAPGETRYELEDVIVMRRTVAGTLPPAAAELLELYVPYCLAALHARRLRRAFAVSHFAQSLDGRIATREGDARWIGCDENQVHAHRMRALCDGILIGSHTLECDRPALTVRHADGTDPVRIVLGAAGDIGCLERAGSSAIVLIDDDPRVRSGQARHVVLPRTGGAIATSAVLEALYEHDILSVYIEGGATTTSKFLVEGNIDVVQLHISPMIIGPGINSFCSPSIRLVHDSVRFGAHLYRSVGDGMMFIGRVAA